MNGCEKERCARAEVCYADPIQRRWIAVKEICHTCGLDRSLTPAVGELAPPIDE